MSGAWPLVALGDIAGPVSRPISVQAGSPYRTIGVKWWGGGSYERQTIDGSQTAAKTLSIVKADDLIINKIWVRHGSTAIATDAVDGCAASGEFPTFSLNRELVEPRWVHWLTQTRNFWNDCAELSRGTSGKNRIKPELFLTIRIPLPPLAEQQRIVAWIDELTAKVSEALSFRSEIAIQTESLLTSAYHRIADAAPRRPMAEVAPLDRRPVNVDIEKSYPQVSVRSFGRGSFHKPPLVGNEVTWQKPFLVKSGDILISNIKAWEGALAVALQEDDERVASHRYLTCVPIAGVATSRFVCFHLLTPEGLHYVGEASPGSADRNRTLSTKSLLRIPIPVPSFEQQLWFDGLCRQVDSLKRLQTETAAELNAMLPSILDKAFKGEL